MLNALVNGFGSVSIWPAHIDSGSCDSPLEANQGYNKWDHDMLWTRVWYVGVFLYFISPLVTFVFSFLSFSLFYFSPLTLDQSAPFFLSHAPACVPFLWISSQSCRLVSLPQFLSCLSCCVCELFSCSVLKRSGFNFSFLVASFPHLCQTVTKENPTNWCHAMLLHNGHSSFWRPTHRIQTRVLISAVDPDLVTRLWPPWSIWSDPGPARLPRCQTHFLCTVIRMPTTSAAPLGKVAVVWSARGQTEARCWTHHSFTLRLYDFLSSSVD